MITCIKARTGLARQSRSTLIVVVALFLAKQLALAQPAVDNPYATFYNVKGHWTDSLRWTNVMQVTDIPKLLDNAGHVDSTLLHDTMKKISDNGGGVLYFPGGQYYFDFDIKLFEGVLLRGEDPVTHRAAKDSTFRPATRFAFPQYHPVAEGLGTPNKTAFKKIVISDKGKKNFGVVYIDINRAAIDFYLDATREAHDNVIVFGVRQNNVAIPEPEIPSEAQISRGKGWQRWPSGRANISVAVREKCTVSNCRLNDSVTDNFEQYNYMTNDGYINQEPILFNYTYHIGISIHRRNGLKLPGVDVLDNYILVSRYFNRVEVFGEPVTTKGNALAYPKEEPQHFQILRDNYSQKFVKQMDNFFLYDKYIRKHDTLQYQLLKPDGIESGKKYPLVVFLHGNGEKDKGSYRLKHFLPMFLREGNREQFPCYVLVPHCEQNKYWVSQDLNIEATVPMQMTISLVDKLKKEHNIDKSKIYLIGISEGGMAAWEAAIRYPKAFAAIVPIASVWNFDEKQLSRIKDNSVWISAGVKDPYIPITYIRLMKSQLVKSGIDLSYHEYPQIQHLSWVPLSFDDKFLPWLFSKAR